MKKFLQLIVLIELALPLHAQIQQISHIPFDLANPQPIGLYSFEEQLFFWGMAANQV